MGVLTTCGAHLGAVFGAGSGRAGAAGSGVALGLRRRVSRVRRRAAVRGQLAEPAPETRPAVLRTLAEVLDIAARDLHADLPARPARFEVGQALEAEWRRERVAAVELRTAEAEVAAAAARYRELRVAAAEPEEPAPSRLGRLAYTVVGVGVLLAVLCMGLAVGFLLGPGPLLVLPAAAALAAVVLVTVHAARRGGPVRPRPVVDDLVEAALEVREAEAVARRARTRAVVATVWWADQARQAKAEVTSWCERHRLPADATALRELATLVQHGGDGRGPAEAVERRRLGGAASGAATPTAGG